MSSHKRSRSATESDAESSKALKGSNTEPAEDLAQANARIHELEAQVKELQNYLYSQNVALYAPATIREQLNKRPDAAKKLAGQVHNAMKFSYDKLIDKISNSRKTGVTSDDLSKAMEPYLEDIERVWGLPGGLSHAFDLVLILGEYSFGHLHLDGGGHGHRPSDEGADGLLCELIQERKKTDPEYDPTDDLDMLKDHAKYLNDYGIENYFSESIELLENWESLSDDEAPEEMENVSDPTKNQDRIVEFPRLPPASNENGRI